MNKLFLGAVLLLALQSGDCGNPPQKADPRPTPFNDGAPLDPHTAQRFRRSIGMGDGWTTSEIQIQSEDRKKYEKDLADWKARNGGAK